MNQGKKRKNLNPAVPMLGSFFVMGLGQLINKSLPKALVWFLIPVLFLGIELSTSTWGKYIDLLSGKADAALASQTVAVNGEENVTAEEQSITFTSLAGILGVSGDDELSDSEEDLYGAEEDLYGTDEDLYGTEEDLYGSEESLYAAEDGSEPEYSYFDAVYEYPNYALSPGAEKNIIRDFGGFFSRGIWGLITLGKLVIGDPYAGKTIELYNKLTPWLIADNSTILLGNGLIALISLSILAFFWIAGIIDAYKSRVYINKNGCDENLKEFISRLWTNAYVYIVIAPALVLILFFTIIPFLYTFLIAFTNYTYKIKLGANLIEWIGFRSFSLAAFDPGWLAVFGQIFLWTIFWAVMSTFTVYALGFINALAVESPLVRGRKVLRTIMILPWALPSLISLMVFRQAFDKDGLINQFLFSSGLMESVSSFLYHIGLQGRPDQPIFWFDPIYNGRLAKACVLLVNLWCGAPYHMMMIIGVLSTIPRDQYEAANIDGATGFQRFRNITLPAVLSATIPSLIMTFGFNFNNFGAIYFLTGGGPLWDPSKVPESMRVIGSSMPGQTDILISWIYKLSFTKGTEHFNVAAVYSIFIFMIIGSIAIFSLVRSKAFLEDAGE